MASGPSADWPGRTIDHEDFARDLARTPSKRALLKAIEDAGGRW